MGWESAAFSGALGMIQGRINQYYASEMASQARAENYRYNEMAANNADRRTRALYEDFYSPAALMRQYKEAGLSPSLMFGGTPGQGGMSGAQGAGTAGQPTTFTPFNMVETAQAAALFAQAEKTREETKTERGENAKGAALLANIGADTGNKEAQTHLTQLQSEWQALENFYQKPFKDLEYNQLEETIDLVKWQAQGAKYAAKKGKIDYKWSQELYDDGVNPMKEQVSNMIADTLLKGAQKNLTEEQQNEVRQHVQYMIDDIFIRTMHLNNETFMVDYDRKLKEAMAEYHKRAKELMGEITNQDEYNRWMELGGKILTTAVNIGALYFLKGGAGATKAVIPPIPYKGITATGGVF